MTTLPTRASSFGPSALATPANALTLSRIAITPVLLILILGTGASWGLLAFWIVLASSDGLDGHLARRYGTTRSGAFLDPLADKVLVLGACFALVVEGTFWWLPVLLIAARELIISGFRSFWGRRGLAVPARYWAKVKTVVQEVAVGFALLPLTSERATWVASAVLWIAVVLTLSTGVNYILEGSRAAFTAGER